MERPGRAKNARRFAAKETFFLKWPRTPRKATNGPSTLTIGWLPTETRRHIGVIKRYLKRACVWKRKQIATRPWLVFIRFWKKEHGPIGRANSFGSTKPGLTPANCWKQTPNGNRRPQFTKSSRLRAARAAMKRVSVWTDSVLNIFCVRNNA